VINSLCDTVTFFMLFVCQPSSMACLMRAAPRFITRVVCLTAKRTVYTKVIFVVFCCICWKVKTGLQAKSPAEGNSIMSLP